MNQEKNICWADDIDTPEKPKMFWKIIHNIQIKDNTTTPIKTIYKKK